MCQTERCCLILIITIFSYELRQSRGGASKNEVEKGQQLAAERLQASKAKVYGSKVFAQFLNQQDLTTGLVAATAEICANQNGEVWISVNTSDKSNPEGKADFRSWAEKPRIPSDHNPGHFDTNHGLIGKCREDNSTIARELESLLSKLDVAERTGGDYGDYLSRSSEGRWDLYKLIPKKEAE